MKSSSLQQAESDSRPAKSYQRIKVRLTLVHLVFSVLIPLAILVSPINHSMEDWSRAQTSNPWGVVFGYFSLFFLLTLLLEIPLSVYEGFWLEHQFQLSNQSFFRWVIEFLKKESISFVIGLFLIEILYFFIRQYSYWWIVALSAWLLFTLLAGKLWHLVILPLFYKQEPLRDEDLKQRMVRLCQSEKMKVENVFSVNLSKTTKKANAAFAGMGRTKRILLADTLVSNFSPDEIESVVAHELGHYRRHHLWGHLIYSAVSSGIVFYGAAHCLERWLTIFAIGRLSDPSSYPLILLTAIAVGLILLPVGNAFSRKMEREADRFSLDLKRNPEAFISTMKKLADINLADPKPHPVIEFFLYSHPSIAKRIEFAKGYVQKNI